MNQRRSIRLKEYDYSQEGAYFITACTKAKVSRFDVYPILKEIAETEWESLPKRFPGMVTDAFVVMPNHIHAIMVLNRPGGRAGASPAPTIGNIVGAYKSLCAIKWLKYIKESNLNIIGAIWQRNYYERIIRSERELNLIREYVILNPSQWIFDGDNPGHIDDDEYERRWRWLEEARPIP